MRKNIFKHEFKMHFRSVINWSLAAAAVVLVYLSFYPAFSKDAEVLNRTMESFPPEFRAAFGMLDVDLSSVLGFFGFVYLFLQILLAIQAAGYGIGLVSIEEREWTADFLLAKPVARWRILTSKLLAVLACLAITQGVVWASAFGFVNAFKGEKSYDPDLMARMLLGLIAFQLFFLLVGLLISLIAKRVRNVTPYAMALGFGMYLLGAFGDMLGESKLELITPFKHFNPHEVIRHGGFDSGLVLISLIAIVVSVIGSYWLYLRRDIPSVA